MNIYKYEIMNIYNMNINNKEIIESIDIGP